MTIKYCIDGYGKKNREGDEQLRKRKKRMEFTKPMGVEEAREMRRQERESVSRFVRD